MRGDPLFCSSTANFEVHIRQDLVVEHEGEPLLDSGLGGLPVVEGGAALVYIVPHKATVAPRHRPSCSSKVAVATRFVEEGVVVGGQGDQAATHTSTTNGALWVQGEASEQMALKPVEES